MDIIQLVTAISLLLITTVVVVVGIWLVKVLQETKKILEDTHSITSSVARPVNSFSEFVMGFKNGFTILNKFFPDTKDESKK